MHDLPILIAGAGIAGLSAAAALARRGEDVLVLEREPAFTTAGAGLQLGPNAVTALRAIGAWDSVEPITSQPPAIHFRDGRSGQLLKRLRLTGEFEKRFGAPYRVAHRGDLHAALLAHCQSNHAIALRTNQPVHEFVDAASTVEVSGIRGSYLLVADGVHSKVRQQLFPGSAGIDSGLVFHRALQTATPVQGVDLDCVTLWMLPGGHVVHYPVGRGGKLNLVCVTDAVSSPAAIASRSCDALASLLNDMQWTIWPGYYVAPLPTWHFGRALLIGDAAHGTLPFLAQGAAMALEDAAALRSEGGRVAMAPSRLPRTTRLHRQTMSVKSAYHMDGVGAVMRNAVLRLLPDRVFHRQLKWLYAPT